MHRTPPAHIRHLWLLAGYGMVLSIVFFSLIPADGIPTPDGMDKVLHVFAYFVLMLWFAQLYLRAQWLPLAVSCTALGVLLEYAQSQTGYRSFSFGDMAANCAGVLAAWMLALAGVDDCVARVERWVYGTAR